jgi:hypothetical protein
MRGDAEIGFQQISELIPVKGIQYLGPLPPEIQNVADFHPQKVNTSMWASQVSEREAA